MNCLRCNGLTVRDDSFAVQTGSSSDLSWVALCELRNDRR